MIEIYKWLFKSQKKIVDHLEVVTGIRTIESFINIGHLPDALGLYRPEHITGSEDLIDSITISERLFEVGDKAVLKILAHEVLHSLEKITNKLEGDHGQQFRSWENTMNSWIDATSFKPMPKISFSRGSSFQRARGVSKLLSYQCECGTRIYNLQEMDVTCNKCNQPFFMTDNGAEDFKEERRLRSKPLIYAASQLRKASDEQIIRQQPFGLCRKILEICQPKSMPVVTDEMPEDYVKELMMKLYRSSINFGALDGVQSNNKHLKRIAYLVKGGA